MGCCSQVFAQFQRASIVLNYIVFVSIMSVITANTSIDLFIIAVYILRHCHKTPGAPFTYFNNWGGGGGPSDFFGSQILVKSDFGGFYERRRDFLGS